MKEKVIELSKELDKLYYPGIYIFLNKKENTFYVGKAISRIFDRVRSDMLSSHKKTLQEFTQNKDTGLYIFKIDSDSNDKVTFNEKLLLIEYSAYVYMIDKGYNSINDISGFSHKTRELYNINKSNICIDHILKFDMNLFWNGFKEVLFDRKYLNDLINENRQLKSDLNYFKREYHNLSNELTKYKNKENETFITLLNNLVDLENEITIIGENYKSIKATFIDLGKNIYFLESEFNEILHQINKKR